MRTKDASAIAAARAAAPSTAVFRLSVRIISLLSFVGLASHAVGIRGSSISAICSCGPETRARPEAEAAGRAAPGPHAPAPPVSAQRAVGLGDIRRVAVRGGIADLDRGACGDGPVPVGVGHGDGVALLAPLAAPQVRDLIVTGERPLDGPPLG